MSPAEVERYAQPPGRGHEKGLEDRVKMCHGLGMSQAGTARELGVSRWQVRKAGERLGLEWKDDRTAEATKAAAAQARKDRVELLVRWQGMAHDQLDAAERAGDQDTQHRALVMAGISTDKAVSLATLANREPDDAGMEQAREYMTILGATINQSAALTQLARKHGATGDEIDAAHRPRPLRGDQGDGQGGG